MDEQRSSSFAKSAFGEESGVVIEWNIDTGHDAIRVGPNEESIKAFVLTFRFFIQNNDAISLDRMTRLFAEMAVQYQELASLANEFSQIRNAVNDFLDSTPPMRITFNGETYTRRQIMEIYIYGHLAHGNEKKRATYEAWRQAPFILPLIENEFVVTMSELLNALRDMQEIATTIVREMENSASGGR